MGVVDRHLGTRSSVGEEEPSTSDFQHEDDVQTIEEAQTVIKQLRDRCRFQTHQTLLWRKKSKNQVYRNKLQILLNN